MGNHKTGKNLICPNCNKEFYINKSRIARSKLHYCSQSCLSRYTAKDRGDKLRKNIYPKIVGKCRQCNMNLIIKSAGFDKPNRQYCGYRCRTIWRNKNIPQSIHQREATRQRAIKLFRGVKKTRLQRERMSKANLGEKSHFWRGGLTDKNRLLRTGLKTKIWREAVFKRDNWTCQICKIRGGKLEADHIKPWSTHPRLRFEISNGRTLCKSCHRKTDTFGYKLQRYAKSL